ncbi:hypothetical protein SAMN05443270_4071 [Lacrimispora sphenoides]|uniref:hypothetical protein n=1 Tax=Lacrimispora sphenoides TaxID=29370 RepID=UPI00044BFB02|nr:hypothetical protein [Lacrimispora sphenoides]EXG85978.1 hypothetical protein K413DRAFT_2790 [Clostridium sp. ASBs410]SEU25968.1 hypothetical protein SAMN05443270_4071 [Lacrimispora sphenoides]
MEEMNETQNIQEKTAEKALAAGKVNNEKGGKKGKKKALLLILLLLIIAGAGGGYWWYTHNQVMDATTKYWFDRLAQDGSLQGKTPTEVQGILNSVVEEGMFNVSMNAKAIFNDAKSEGSIGLENIPENRYYCRVVIRRDDTNEVLYESQGIKPGQYIDKIKLKQNLPAGNYACTAQVIATDPESLDDIGQVQVKIQVNVLN